MNPGVALPPVHSLNVIHMIISRRLAAVSANLDLTTSFFPTLAHSFLLQAMLEAKQGIPGFHLTQEKMEEISAEKGAVDSAKGASLNEMSAMVLQLNQKIADKKARLAPIIKGDS